VEVTVARQAPPDPEPSYDGAAEATRSSAELFQWSAYVHVGAGADCCEHATDGQCSEHRHFHCWLCLPNTFQARDIHDKAMAAKARKRRLLLQDGSNGREPSDSYLVLTDALDAWSVSDETWQALRERIADRRVVAEQPEIIRALKEEERFEHHGADLEEFKRVANLPEPERDEQQFEALSGAVEEFRIEFEARCKAQYEAELQTLIQTAHDELLESERRWQIDQAASEAFLHHYYTWAYYTCALRPREGDYPTERAFARPESLKTAAPEIITALRETYRSLESRMFVRGDGAGN
jgi:hypothetical protein